MYLEELPVAGTHYLVVVLLAPATLSGGRESRLWRRSGGRLFIRIVGDELDNFVQDDEHRFSGRSHEFEDIIHI